MTRFGYLGPEGTFTSMALDAWSAAADGERVAFGSVDAALTALRAGDIDGAMVPIENSVEGGVSATLDALASGDPLVVTGEVLVPVTFVLAAPPGTSARRRARRRHPLARVGAGARVDGRAPAGCRVRPHALDRGSRARVSSRAGSPTTPPSARRPPRGCTGSTELAHGIGDMQAAVTRFVLVARPGVLPEPTGADKTTVVLFQRDDHAGGLLALLEQFAARGINMTRLESRPTKESMGSYCFSIDLEGHVLDERVGEALMGLRRICAEVRFLGSYPRADRQRASIAPLTSDTDFTAARSWLEGIRSGRS